MHPDSTGEENNSGHRFVLDTDLGTLSESMVSQHASGTFFLDSGTVDKIFPHSIEIGQGVFGCSGEWNSFPEVSVVQDESQLTIFCTCAAATEKLCEHQALVLTALIRRDALNVFFHPERRHEKLKKAASDYGLENEKDLDRFFRLEYQNGKVSVVPRDAGLVSINGDSLRAFQEMFEVPQRNTIPADDAEKISVVLKQHKHYKYLQIELYRSQSTKEGKLKNPMEWTSPLDLIWKTDDPQQLKFYTAIHKFQGHSDAKRTESDLEALKAVIGNPLQYDFYCHDSAKSEKVNAQSVFPVKTDLLSGKFTLDVEREGDFFAVGAHITANGNTHPLEALRVQLTYFVQAGNTFYLADLSTLAMLDLLKRKQDRLLVHQSKYWSFKSEVLKRLEDRLEIDYRYIQPATRAQLQENGFEAPPAKLIYLSDFGSQVMIIPVVRYGDTEIQLRSDRQVYALDYKNTSSKEQFMSEFLVKRDERLETEFKHLILSSHLYLEEQDGNSLSYYYLHKRHFLEEEWFPDTFESCRNAGIEIFGFRELEGNKYNPEKIKVDIKVLSGINWFNAEVEARFGKKKVSLKHLHKAIRNKSRYVTLDDGTKGILPGEWIERFARYFNSGEIIDLKTIRIPKIGFSAVEQLFEEEMLDTQVKNELKEYRARFAGFESIVDVEVPEALNASLRTYQKEGLNWLNFLDDFNFGGCLADDMGLGKSIQIIAFILSQREKSAHNVNLLVIPATLIFNWQQEVEKFAPSIRILTLHGSDRQKNTADFERYEIILTSYGTLLSDVHFLKEYAFNYIFLDESQNIRNPGTERYKAVRLLQSRNKIAITGTPLENNTFDLYSQFSFACPGLLGSKQYFRDVYSVPVDQFKNSKRAQELHDKIKPFMLRRTKQQVATDLPPKTEMILYCEMGEKQRNMYKASEKEFREYISATTEDELNKSSMNVLRGLTKLRQICDAPVLADELSGEIGSAKIDLLMEQIQGKSSGHKILVFSQFVSMLELIRKELQSREIRHVMLTGKTRNRKAVVNDFQDNPEIKVFLISLKAGGTGLNLTAADYVYLVDPWWNPAVENQAIDRAHRIGQQQHVIAVRMICPDTVEEKILQLQAWKKQLATELISDDTAFLKSLSKEKLLGLLSDLQ